ncbi:MAG TPA: hypothetical protein VK335_29245 [Bryobacteraceae bacterium]|nr:hypothetical protein [Bryobacteraceae bacterium]
MQTRRQWLMQVGGGAVLAGWSGIDLTAAELPPGVYEASRDHLGHALAGHPMASGGETELVQVHTGTFQPAFFQPDQYRQLLQLTGIILGEEPDAAIVHEIAEWIDLTLSDAAAVRAAARALSPPHRTLAIHYYGAESLRKLEEFDAQKIVRDGFAWIDTNPLSQVELNEIIAGSKSDHPTVPFFLYLKERVIDGFYTSRAGLDELGYRGNAFYASPPGCEHLHG